MGEDWSSTQHGTGFLFLFYSFTVLLHFLSLVGFKYELWNVVFHMTWNVPRCVSYDMERNVSNIRYENGVSNSSNAMAHFMVIHVRNRYSKIKNLAKELNNLIQLLPHTNQTFQIISHDLYRIIIVRIFSYEALK